MVSWAGVTSPVNATESRSNEGMSFILSKEVWSSSETFEATIGVWGLSAGRAYTLEWSIRTGNGSEGPDELIRNWNYSFTASSSGLQIQVEAYHLNSSTTHLHRLLAELSDSSGPLVDNQANFSAFTNTLPVPYSDIVFFGDSLSDMGNSYNQWGTPDSPPYWNGRYTNGEVWSTQFGQFMGVSMTPGRGSGNGNNRAYSGAHAGEGSYLFVIPNVGKQVDDYLQNHQINANELVVIWCGGNDFVHSDEQDTQQIVDYIDSHMNQLSNAGATEFLVLELPPLDTVPRINEENDADGVAAMHERILDFNMKLHSMLDTKVNSSSLTIHRGMSWEMFDTVYNNPSYFGLTNITHPACEHDGFSCDNGDTIAPNAEEYIYFDKMHPTLTMHYLVNMYIREVMGIEDIDGDGVADISDNCVDTLPGVEVGSDGCDIPPPDADQDGVPDDEDDCENTDSGLPVDGDGCANNQTDADGDGVSDADDICPNTELGRQVNSEGCSQWQIDSDDDGVVNALDECPDTQPDRLVGSNGCSAWQTDSDDDGVSDANDACPNTDWGLQVNVVGCATNQIDDDADGVFNANDDCPDSIGEVNDEGCAADQRDTDSDGVTDDLDICPDTEWLDPVNNVGCSAKQRDTDGDGPKDSDDGCPLVAGSIAGCPILSVQITLIEMPNSNSNIANLSIEISCESNCLMNWTLSNETDLIAEGSNVANGTYFVMYSEVPGTSEKLTARTSIVGMWATDDLTVNFPALQTESDDEGGGETSNDDENIVPEQESSKESGFDLDNGSIALIAMLLLLNVGVIAALLSIRSRSKKLNPEEIAASAFERSLFSQQANQTQTQFENVETQKNESEPSEIDLPDMMDFTK